MPTRDKAAWLPLTALLLSPAALAERSALERTIRDAAPAAIDLRHRLHAAPELSNREFETAKTIAAELTDYGLEVQTGIAGTGVVGMLRGDPDGPVVALRADMDALPVTEATDLPFRSTRRTTHLGKDVGVAHACGHDIHMSVQLGVARVLASLGDALPGTVMFIFQPAEEGAPPGERGGAEVMLEEGVFERDRPGAIFSFHAFPDWPVGKIAVTPGPTMASSDRFRVVLSGRQIHGAYPHLGVDPIVLAAQTIVAFQTIPSRSLDPLQPAVVSVGTIDGGERFNIIPGRVAFTGTVRAFSSAVQDTIERRMGEILAGQAKAAGAEFEFEYRRITPAVVNDPGLGEWATASLRRTLGADHIVQAGRTMAAEDFAFFSNEVPGFHFRLGVVAPGTTSGGLHTPDFRADDGSIEVGMRALTGLVMDYLASPPL